MSYMAKASVSVRELQQNLKLVMARVERGETVEVTRAGGLRRGSRRRRQPGHCRIGQTSRHGLASVFGTESSRAALTLSSFLVSSRCARVMAGGSAIDARTIGRGSGGDGRSIVSATIAAPAAAQCGEFRDAAADIEIVTALGSWLCPLGSRKSIMISAARLASEGFS
jgi:hypothetical protein